jgi:thiol:disulfide interchange protein
MAMRALLVALLLAAPAGASGPPAADTAPIYDAETDGVRQIEAGARFCAQSGRRLVLNLGTNKCSTCRVVNRAMHDPKFYGAFVNDFYPVFIDITPGSKNAALLKRFEVDPKRGLPIIIFYDGNLKPAEMTKNGEMTALAKKGEREVQLWFLSHFPKNEER